MTFYNVNGRPFEELICGECGIIFYAPQEWVVDRRDRGNYGKEFNCPNGHTRVWRESELDRVQRERNRLKQQNARLEEEAREAKERAYQEADKALRVKRRAEAALCPCCKRHFHQLARHIKNKHPNIVPMTQKQAG